MSSSEQSVGAMLKGDQSRLDQPPLEKSPLEKHVAYFSVDGFFSSTTVTEGLNKIHATSPGLKGVLIAGFNSAHAGSRCPFFPTKFKRDERTGNYAPFLHLGTTRILNSDGSINEARWDKFVAFVSAGKTCETLVVTKSEMKNYLLYCLSTDPEESDTGRNTHSFFSFKSIQATAAIKAWDEVYDRLACGWIDNKILGDKEPYISLEIIREFFVDSKAAFLRAERKELPVPKPSDLVGGSATTVSAAL